MARWFHHLPASEFARHIVVDPGLLVILRRTPVAADGTVSLNGKIFASIADGYVEIVRYPRHAHGRTRVFGTRRVASRACRRRSGRRRASTAGLSPGRWRLDQLWIVVRTTARR